jgi:predicted glutamine amidotransferase
MCELFALSSDMPANVTFSLGVFGERGGRLGPHKDGWGIAFKEGRDFRSIKEAAPASASACLRFIESHEFRSEIVLSHLRLASVPRAASYTNTHPFARELYGACHVFAHNGNMPGVLSDIRLSPTWNFPLGETDSERAFCALMDRLRSTLAPDDIFSVTKKLPIIQDWADALAQHGTANFMLSDSTCIYAHRSTNLFYLERQCTPVRESFGSHSLRVALVPAEAGSQHVSLIATQPLTANEMWLPLPLGKVVPFRHGRRVF